MTDKMDDVMQDIASDLAKGLKLGSKNIQRQVLHKLQHQRNSQSLRVKCEFNGERRSINISRPVTYEHLRCKISEMYSCELNMFFTQPNGEVYAPILSQSDLDTAVNLVDNNDRITSLRIFLTSPNDGGPGYGKKRHGMSVTDPHRSNIRDSPSPPPGSLPPHESTFRQSLSRTSVNSEGEFIPEGENIKHQSLKVIGWITLEWTDERIQWVPEDYDSKVEEVHAQPSEIWKPEVIIDNSPNGEWILDRTEIRDNAVKETKSDGTIVTFSELEFVFVLERRPIFYVVNVLLPIVLASFLSCVVFLLPLQSSEKVGYILTLILAIAVLLTLIADSLPQTSVTASILGLYLAFTLFFSVICALISVLLLSNFHSEEKVDTTSCFYKCTKFIASLSNRKRCMVWRKERNRRNLTTTGNKVTPIRNLTDETSHNVDEYEEKVYTRKELSHILDRFCFCVSLTLICICTFAFLVALSVGARNHHT